jgi:hypothetical protein
MICKLNAHIGSAISTVIAMISVAISMAGMMRRSAWTRHTYSWDSIPIWYVAIKDDMFSKYSEVHALI